MAKKQTSKKEIEAYIKFLEKALASKKLQEQ